MPDQAIIPKINAQLSKGAGQVKNRSEIVEGGKYTYISGANQGRMLLTVTRAPYQVSKIWYVDVTLPSGTPETYRLESLGVEPDENKMWNATNYLLQAS